MNFKGQLFQLKDNESEDIGLIWTDNEQIKENRIEDEWNEFINSYDEDADEFAEYLNNKFNPTEEFPNGIYFERVFVSDCNIL